MPDKNGFKHITVSAPAEEDIVIHAGLRRHPEEQGSTALSTDGFRDSDLSHVPVEDSAENCSADVGQSPEASVDSPGKPADAGSGAPLDAAQVNGRQTVFEPSSDESGESDGTERGTASSSTSSESRMTSDDSYHETTLEDLESSKMPAMQKAIVIVAVICLVAALVYYFAVMR